MLARLITGFDIVSSPAEEEGHERLPEWLVEPVVLPVPFYVPTESEPRLWAWRKAADVVEQHRDRVQPGTLVLGADTIVVAPGRILGKP
ncbi:MAG: nucleoside triphosphate pyrophosphatase, partial [Chloroflexia bacterium]|nr:nucleoside triphosphate pyrophosphatase [Chloroflexia bacterium]